MANTTFSGPVRAGTEIQQEQQLAIVKNVGFAKISHRSNSRRGAQSTTAADTGIVIPANSKLRNNHYFTTACGAANLSDWYNFCIRSFRYLQH